MEFAPGARIGSFEILSQLGTGGMGEVYRARDTRLDRIVALKFLTGAHAPTADRVERFTREARAISRLTHPHICTLHDLGEQNGLIFLVMEYVQGPTLADRLERGPLRLEEVLRFGVQMADALQAAHRAGIVHRDLKPGNVILTRDGVKLLDFGLAKLRAERQEDIGLAVTASLPSSEAGRIVGTIPYMAPEQLEGKAVDARTDLFALGVVLYEMTTGERPFRGDSQASLIASILREDPAPLRMRQPLTPLAFDRAVRRCLAKDPDDRWQTARDLSAELAWIRDTIHEPEAQASPARRSRRSLALVGGSVAALAVLLTAMLPVMRKPIASLPSFHEITFRRGVITSARFGPDGQTIVYSASWEGQPYELYLTRAESYESRVLGVSDARLSGISGSGEMAFIRGPQSILRSLGTLARVPLAGGAPRELLDNVTAADWSPDGSQIAVVRSGTGGRRQVEFPLGTVLYESTSSVTSLRVSRQGDRLALIEGQGGGQIVVIDRSGKKTILATGLVPAFGLSWSPDGTEVWFTGSRDHTPPALRAVSMAGKERALALAPDVLQVQDVFADGRVLAIRHHGREGFACRAPGEANDRDMSWFDGSSIEALSSDGRTAIFGEDRGGGGPKEGIYLRRTDGSPAIRLADGYPEDLSPDGRWVLADPSAAPATATEKGWVLVPVGAGSPRSLPLGSLVALYEANFLPDGKRVVFGGREKGRGPRIFIQGLNGGVPRPISPEGVRTDALPTPDGAFVEGTAAGKHSLYPVNGGEPRELPFLTAEDSVVQWTPDGRFLYVLRAPRWLDTPATLYQTMEAVIDKVDRMTGARTAWKTIRTADPVGLEAINDIFITPDGLGYCYGYLRTLSDLFIIEGVK